MSSWSSRRATNILNVSQCLLFHTHLVLLFVGLILGQISQNPGWPFVGEDDLELLIFSPPPKYWSDRCEPPCRVSVVLGIAQDKYSTG